ncbi:MAG: hypothetical protein RSD13_06045 [Clostridium sp.]
MTVNYDDMTIEKVVEYFDKEMSEGRSAKDIEINDFGVAERVIRKRLARKGIKIDTKKYDNSIKKVVHKPKLVTEPIEVVNQSVEIIKCEEGNTLVTPIKCDDGNTLVIPKRYEENLFQILENSDKILNLIKGYDKECDAQYDNDHHRDLIIELPLETVKDFRTSIRVNNVIWDQFNTFCEGKIFTKRDLISQALKDFMEKYNRG